MTEPTVTEGTITNPGNISLSGSLAANPANPAINTAIENFNYTFLNLLEKELEFLNKDSKPFVTFTQEGFVINWGRVDEVLTSRPKTKYCAFAYQMALLLSLAKPALLSHCRNTETSSFPR